MEIKKINCLLAILILLPILANAEPILHLGHFIQKPKQPASYFIVKEAYQRLHINIDVIYLPASRSLSATNNGKIDGDIARIIGMEKKYPNLLMINVPITHVVLYACSKNKVFKIKDWKSLKPYRIAYVRGAKIIENNLHGFQTEAVTTIEQAFLMLEHNRVDILVTDEREIVKELPKYPNIKVLTSALYSFPVYHYLHKKHAALVPKLEVVLQQMNADKSIEKIKRAINEQHNSLF